MAVTGSLHNHAVEAERHLEALATGLAEQGAPPETIKAVTKMADVARQLVKVLGKGQEATGDREPPEPEEAPPEAAGAPAPGPGGRPTLDDAIASTHRDRVAAAQRRRRVPAPA